MIETIGVKKSFGGVKALKGVDLKVEAGEIHALLGENGAGKSTLMKIVSGAISRDEGVIRINGEEVELNTTQAAKDKGIGIIYQEFSLVPEMSVTENIYMRRLGERTIINWRELHRAANELIRRLGFDLDVTQKVKHLSVAKQQIVEIAKALSEEVQVLILDEPSAVLGPADIHQLFSTLRMLRDRGVSIIYISHRLEELFELSDKITVLKDGATVSTLKTSVTSKDELVSLMLGRSLNAMFPEKHSVSVEKGRDKTFSVSGLRISDQDEAVEFEVRSGEIAGLGGLVGSGRTELLRATFGADRQPAKIIFCDTVRLLTASPREAIRAGIGMVPEDRKQHGGILNQSIRENISLASYRKITGCMGFIKSKKETQTGTELCARLNVRMNSLDQPLGSLSGGNQQKVILAKWLNIDADLLLIDEPTRGVDVGARAEIYKIIRHLAETGLAILLVSSDWEELLGLCDRVMVIRNGKITGQATGNDLNEERLLRLAIGEDNN